MLSVLNIQQELEADKLKYHAQRRRLCQENAWLRDELSTTQTKLADAEQVCLFLFRYVVYYVYKLFD